MVIKRLDAEQWHMIMSETTLQARTLLQDEAGGEDSTEVNPCAVLKL